MEEVANSINLRIQDVERRVSAFLTARFEPFAEVNRQGSHGRDAMMVGIRTKGATCPVYGDIKSCRRSAPRPEALGSITASLQLSGSSARFRDPG